MQTPFMDKITHPKARMLLSRIIALIIIAVWLTTQSYWKENHPLIGAFLFLVGTILLAIGSLGRMWCSLYIAGYKNKNLVRTGPYSMMRNPLYFFSMLGFVGFGFTTQTLLFPLIFFILFILYYTNVMKKEERDLEAIFQEEYIRYRQEVPLFFPKLSLFQDVDRYTVQPKVYFHHIKSAIWFVWLIGIVYVLETLKSLGFFPQWGVLI